VDSIVTHSHPAGNDSMNSMFALCLIKKHFLVSFLNPFQLPHRSQGSLASRTVVVRHPLSFPISPLFPLARLYTFLSDIRVLRPPAVTISPRLTPGCTTRAAAVPMNRARGPQHPLPLSSSPARLGFFMAGYIIHRISTLQPHRIRNCPDPKRVANLVPIRPRPCLFMGGIDRAPHGAP
jgi:hypothetical protein